MRIGTLAVVFGEEVIHAFTVSMETKVLPSKWRDVIAKITHCIKADRGVASALVNELDRATSKSYYTNAKEVTSHIIVFEEDDYQKVLNIVDPLYQRVMNPTSTSMAHKKG